MLAERGAAAEAMKQGGLAAPPLGGVQPPAPIAPARPELAPPFPHVAFEPSIWTTAPPPVQPTGSFFYSKPIPVPRPFEAHPRNPLPAAILWELYRKVPIPIVMTDATARAFLLS